MARAGSLTWQVGSWDSVDNGGRYDAFDLVAGIKESKGHSEHQDARHQPGADFQVGIDSESGMESLLQTGHDVGKATEYDSNKHKGGEEDATLTTTRHLPRDSCKDDEAVAGHTLGGKGVSMTPISLARNVEVGAIARTGRLGNDVMIEPDMRSIEHGQTMAQKSTDVDGAAADEPWVDPPLGTSVEGVTNPKGARKWQKDITKGITGAETACAGNDPCEGSVDLELLTGYIAVPLLAMELEFLNNARSEYKGLQPNSKLEEDLKKCMPKLVLASGLHGLINVVILYDKECISGKIWDSFKPALHADLRYVFMPLLETTERHWLLLVADLCEHYFLVYDSLSSAVHKSMQALVDSAMIRNCYLLLEHNFCLSFQPTLVGGVNHVTQVVVSVGTSEEDCVSACIPTIKHLR
ncbi:hypothetical protein Cgig2_031117 [Carnegiea gigantea]|uniref:Ubiquitin-like protease family profile domain-containing protein n=1 Tax=Carnegiea gigantea TaxID=171969 RepID=A0A9Q1Q7J7_9CARY|nr:hypothetical protein Cgig2_031117 [Carnegiea gigantea]